jgi:hypothetical protein
VALVERLALLDGYSLVHESSLQPKRSLLASLVPRT